MPIYIGGRGGSNRGAGYQIPQQQLPDQWVTRTPLFIINQQPQLPDVLTSAYTLDLTTIGALPEGTLMQTRASSATFFDSTGILRTAAINEERFDFKWNGSSWVSGGLLSEEQRTNNCAPRDISSWSVWGGAGNTTAPTATGIDGVSTSGHTMVPSTSGASAHLLVGSAPPSSSTPYVYSVYGKAAGYTRIVQLAISGVHVPFTLSGSGSVDSGGHTSSSGTATNKAIATVGSGGWYRFQALYTQTPGPSSDSYGLAVVDSGYTNQDATSYSFAGDGTSGVTIDAPQGEPGNFATSYIPTPSGSVTRSADVVTAASKASQWLAAGPSDWEIEDLATGGITTTTYGAGTFTFPQNVRYRSVIFYPAGTTFGFTVDQTIGALTQVATGTVIGTAVVAQTLGALVQAATDTVLAQASTTQALGALGQAATTGVVDKLTAAQTLGALSQVAAATAPDAITVAQNLGALTQTVTGTVVDVAAAAQTLGALVQAATGGVIDVATAAQTLGALSQVATASAPAGLTAAQTLGALGQTTATTNLVALVASQTLGALAQAATGTVTDAATVTQALGALGQTSTSSVVDSAVVAQTLGALVQAATATNVGAAVNLDAAQTLGALGQALTGTVVDTATVAQTLGPLSQTVAATHPDTASVAQTLGAIVQALTGAVIDTATVNQALGALNQTATAASTTGFLAAQTLGGLVQAATGKVVDAATVAQTLGALTQTTTGGPVARATTAQTLGPLGQAATASIPRIVTVDQVLGALAQTASLNVPNAEFAANQILGALGQAATSTVANRALAAQVLGALTQSATARSTPPTHIHISGRLKSAKVAGRLSRTSALQGRLGQRTSLQGQLE